MAKQEQKRTGWVCDGLSKGQAEALVAQLRIMRASARLHNFRDDGHMAVEVREISAPNYYGVYCPASDSVALFRQAKAFCEAARWAWSQSGIEWVDEQNLEEWRARERQAEADAGVL